MKNKYFKVIICLLAAALCFVVLSAFASNEKKSTCPNTDCEYRADCDRDVCPSMQGGCNRGEKPCGAMQGGCGNCK